jgi:hypothetical protein
MNNKYGFDLDKETLEAIVFLIANDYAHCGMDEDGLSVYARVNDTFTYSASDSEEIPLNEIKSVANEVLKYHAENTIINPGWFPLLLWTQNKRHGMEFIPEVKKEIDEFLGRSK